MIDRLLRRAALYLRSAVRRTVRTLAQLNSDEGDEPNEVVVYRSLAEVGALASWARLARSGISARVRCVDVVAPPGGIGVIELYEVVVPARLEVRAREVASPHGSVPS